MLEKLFEKLLFGSSIVRNSWILDPKAMIENSHETNVRCMKNLLNILIKLKIITAVFGDKSQRIYRIFKYRYEKNMEKFTVFYRNVH